MDRQAVERLEGLLQRAHVLSAYRDGPAGRSTIADRARCSPSTVYRAEQYLAERGLIEDTPGGPRVTGPGEVVLDQFERCLDVVEGALALDPLLSVTDPPQLVEHLPLLSSAELVEQEPGSPYHIEHRVREVIAGTDERMAGMATGLGSPTLAETMFERIRAGVRVEWVLPAETFEYFRTEYGDLAEQAVSTDETAVYVSDEIPVDLAVYDETLLVMGFDEERGILAAAAITDEPAAIDWAEDLLDGQRDAAERVA